MEIFNMSWKKYSINDKTVEQFITSDNAPIVRIANEIFGNYKDIQSFGIDSVKEPVLYFVTNLKEWCEIDSQSFKVDFYECKKDCVNGEDWWLCLRREDNKTFKFDDISPKIKLSLKKEFAKTYNKFVSSKCICLMTSADANELAKWLKKFLDNLRNGENK